ncbi:MAG: (4Fe-4S)-binding protein, partial [Deltaproteobacteria bacterium]|nr:(4Fe-4S)-binding protein [Deltaproteobacteria bacterium]
SIGGADAVLVVTEPSVSGAHDMERVVQLAEFFKIPAMVCVNKYDLNPEKTNEIEEFTIKKGLAFLGHIPFDPVFTKAMVQGQTIFEYDNDSEACGVVKQVWGKIGKRLGIDH